MPGGSDNYIKRTFNIFKIVITIFAVFIIASCPEPMTDNLLAEVEDTVGPVFTITTPDLEDLVNLPYYFDTIDIVGNVKDFSNSSQTILGSVHSLSYSELYNPRINGIVTFDSSGTFNISIDALSPSQLDGDQYIVLSATDWNGNVTPKIITFFTKNTGPVIIIYDRDTAADKVYSSALSNDVVITGIIGLPADSLTYAVDAVIGTDISTVSITGWEAAGDYSYSFNPSARTPVPMSGDLTILMEGTAFSKNSTKTLNLKDDDDAPEIDSYTFLDNDVITFSVLPSGITGNEGLYTTAAGVTGNNAVTEADFELKIDGTTLIPLTDWNFSIAPTEGDESFQISITSGLPGTPDGSEELTFAPKPGEVFDRIGNPANPAVFLITENLHDKQVPTVSSVTQTDATHVEVVFSEDVNEAQAETFAYYSNPVIPIAIPATGAVLSGGDTVTLTFGSTIDPGVGLDIIGGVIFDTTVPVPNALATVNGHSIIDGVAPTIFSVDSNRTTGTYIGGDVIDITIGFSETVFTTGTPTISLNTGVSVDYFDGDGTNALIFRYTVGTDENVTRLEYNNTGSLSGTIADGVGNPATLLLPSLSSSDLYDDNLVIDALGPTVSSVDSNRTTGTYIGGDVIDITVGFSEVVNVTGTPTISLNTGVSVDYFDGDGTNALIFRYTVGTDENVTRLEYNNTGSLSGTIADGVGNPATLLLPGLSSSDLYDDNLVIDALGPTVSGVDSNKSDGAYKEGVVIDITVGFSEVVDVTGTPAISLNTGVSVDYFDGDGTNALIFRYTVGANENVDRLDYTSTGSLSGTIEDSVGNTATLQLPGLTSTDLYIDNIEIDTTAPELESVVLSDTATSSPGASDGDKITFNFNEPINESSITNFSTSDDPEAQIKKLGTIDIGGGGSYGAGFGTSNDLGPLSTSSNSVIITLANLEGDDADNTQPFGDFTNLTSLTDLAGNSASEITVTITGSWDATDPVTTTSHVAGPFTSGQVVSVTLSSEVGATIYYTTDGTDPSTSSTEYSSSFDITGTSTTVTLKFFAVDVYNNQESIKSEDFVFP